MTSKVFAILIDGGFLSKRFVAIKRESEGSVRGMLSEDVRNFIDRLCAEPDFKDARLLRAYYYDASPSEAKLSFPVSGGTYDAGRHPAVPRKKKFLDEIQKMKNVAFREGALTGGRWRLREEVIERLIGRSSGDDAATPLKDEDFILRFRQKGVDMRIGLDIARLAMGKMVDSIIVVTADSDFVPALKFARREGVRVYLNHLGNVVSRDEGILIHSDVIMGMNSDSEDWSMWFNPL